MEKSAAGAAGAIDDLFVQEEEIIGVVVVLVADHVHEPGPAVANANDLVAFADSAKSNGADGGIEAGNVTASGKDADNAFFSTYSSHDRGLPFPWIPNRKLCYPEELLGRVKERFVFQDEWMQIIDLEIRVRFSCRGLREI